MRKKWRSKEAEGMRRERKRIKERGKRRWMSARRKKTQMRIHSQKKE